MEAFDIYNDEVWHIWEKYRSFIEGKRPVCPIQRTANTDPDVVFVGMNPSFSEQWIKKIIAKLATPEYADYKSLGLSKIFQYDRNALSRREIITAIDRESELIHPYHRAFERLVAQVGRGQAVKWASFDLFAWRETSQIAFLRRIHESKTNLHPFFKEQLTLAFQTLHKMSPKIVVVANAAACHLLVKYFGAKHNPTTCTYRVELTGDLNFVFSGMLSGQRALDTYSFERVAWQLRGLFPSGE